MPVNLRPLFQPFFRKPPVPPVRQTRAFHEDYNENLEEQTAPLSDGRVIGFAEYGVQTGTPVFFFHGAPGCRYDGIAYHKPAEKLGIRIITPDRPGHGYSSPKPGRTLSSYAADISELAKHLNISQYYAFGQSGGGPYAVAAAHSSPEELISSTVVCGMAPPAMVTIKDAGAYTYFALLLTATFPRLLATFSDFFFPPSYWGEERNIKRAWDWLFKLMQPRDQEATKNPTEEELKMMAAWVRTALAQGFSGTYYDSVLYWNTWDFALEDVKRKVTLVFADEDNRTPVAFGEYYKKHLQSADLIVMKDATHIDYEGYEEAILSTVVGRPVEELIELTEQVDGVTYWTKKKKEDSAA